MVAVVSGSGLGLFTSSASTLGAAGSANDPTIGRFGDRVYVNSATGNLVVQSTDERLSAVLSCRAGKPGNRCWSLGAEILLYCMTQR